MRALSVLLIPLCLVATGAGPLNDGAPKAFEWEQKPNEIKLAALGDSLPGLLIDLVNDSIKGEIRPRKVTYKAPATAILDDIVVVDPRGRPVAQVDHIEATASLTAILAGRIEIDSLRVKAPRLLLNLKNGKLNLAEAFSPKKASDGAPPDLTVSIERFSFDGGALRFRDGKNITIIADDARASGNVRIQLKEGKIRVEVNALQVKSGAIKLKDLDVPFSEGQAGRVVYRNNRITLTDVTAKVLGRAFASAGGVVGLRTKAGDLSFSGRVNAQAGVWPDRLAAPPFPLPAFNTAFTVRGPFARPVVTVDGRSQGFTAFEYKLDGTTFGATISPSTVTLRKVDAKLNGGGRIKATGSVAIKDLGLNLDVKVIKVPLSVAAAPAKLKPAPRGLVSGDVTVGGRADGKSPISVDADVALSNPRAFDLNLPSTVNVTAGLSIVGDRIAVNRSSVRAKSRGVSASATGNVDLGRKTVALTLNARTLKPLSFVDDIPPELTVGAASIRGRVDGPFDRVRVTGGVTATNVAAYGVTSPEIKAQLRVDSRRLVVDKIVGRVLDGDLDASATVNLSSKARPIAATVRLEGADLASVDQDVIRDLKIQGIATIDAKVDGVAKAPIVTATVNADSVEIQNEILGQVSTRLTITPERLVARSVSIRGPLTSATSKRIQFDFASQALAGRLLVNRLALDVVRASRDLNLAGGVDGIVDLSGTAPAPRVFARLNVDALAFEDNAVGSGPVDFCLRPANDHVVVGPVTAQQRCLRNFRSEHDVTRGESVKADATAKVPLIVQASGRIAGELGRLSLRAGYNLDTKQVHARARVRDIEVGPLVKTYAPTIGPLEGVASARATIFGPVDALNADVSLLIPNTTTFVERKRTRRNRGSLVDELRAYQSRGAIRATAKLRDGILAATLCGFPSSTNQREDAICTDGSTIQIAANGPIRQADAAFDFKLKYDVKEQNLSRLIASLRDNDLQASAHVEGDARLWRRGDKDEAPFVLEDLPQPLAAMNPADDEANAKTAKTADKKSAEADEPPVKEAERPVGFEVDLRVLSQSILAPGAPRATLARVARIHVDSEGTVTLKTPLRYEVGDSEIIIKGGLTPERIDATVDGTVALALLKLAPNVISNASGTAVTKLKFEGPYRPLPRIRGEIVPSEGAIITPRGFGQQIQFAGGKLVFSGLPGNPLAQRVRAEELSVSVDEGAASLDGDVVVQLPETAADSVRVTNWNLRASGVGIRIRRATTFIESAFDLSLKGPQAKPVLAGIVEVTDGFIREQFELKNFVLTSAPDAPPTPLVELLRPASLENLVFDVNIGVRNFRARADIATIGMDAILVGDLRLTKSARLYAISGAVEAAQGEIRFPYAQFDIEQTRIEFPPASAGLEPKIYLDARSDLAAPKNGLNTDLSCELVLDGDIEKLQLALQAPDAPRSVSETDLLKFVLFGVPLTAGDLSADPDAALRAVSSELTSDVSRELEQAIANNFGAALQLQLFAESTRAGAGLRYEVGSRLDVEGETGVAYGNGTEGLGGLAGHVRVRLLLFDHLPGFLGEEAAVEGQIKTSGAVASDATRGELRLTWRVFEQ